MKEERITVKHRSVTITVYPWRHPSGKNYWRFQRSDGKHVTRSTLEKAKEEAKKHAQDIHRGTLDLSDLTPDQIRIIQRILEVNPSLQLVDEFLVWHGRKRPRKLVADAYTDFMAIKAGNAGKSTQHERTLRKHVAPFVAQHGQQQLADITVADVENYLVANPENGNRTRRNIRASLVTFFRWCRLREYLPDERTVAEKTEIPVVADTIPGTYTPSELALLLANVRPAFLPWLATAALAGVRTDEIRPIAGSRKSPLDWSDFKWERDIIIVRPETAKMRQRRIIPIVPRLHALLFPIRKESGPICTVPPSRDDGKGGDEAETARLGALVGGWRTNALRHSFISYRCAQVGVGVTALEAGNSEAECKASYLDAKSAAEAAEWFGEQSENIA